MPDLPLTITLCGSARFERMFHAWNEALTISGGHAVFGLAVYPSLKGEREWYSPEEKKRLDEAHLRKIERSDAILVINQWAYIGPSTLAEIKHARELRKTVYATESWGKGCGIGAMHDKRTQAAAIADEVGDEDSVFVSPLDTFAPHMRWATDLLGPAGSIRSRYIDLLKRAEFAHLEKTS